MGELKGRIVRSLSGRDQGRLMVIVGVCADGRWLLSDGKVRRLETPKKKKAKHARLIEEAGIVVAEDMMTNRGIRRALKRASAFLEREKG